MYIPRLDEFELEAIDKLLELIEEKTDIIQLARVKAEELEDEQAVDYILKGCDIDLNIFSLWITQLSNAKVVVEKKEQVTNS